MGDRLTAVLRGWGILPPSWNVSQLSATESTYTEANPRPGTSSTTALLARSAPQVLGAQSKPVTIRGSHAGGFPGVNEDGGAVMYYFPDDTPAEAVTDSRHWRPPWIITGCRNFGTTLESDYVDAAVGPHSGKVVLVQPRDTGGGDATYTYNAQLNSWTTNASGPLDNGAIAFLPGSAEVLLWVSEEGKAYRSEDYAATWVLHSRFAPLIDSGGAYTYDGAKRRMVVDGAGNLMFCGKRSTGNAWDFWASSDQAHTWTPVASSFAAKDVDLCATPDGTIVAAYVSTGDALTVAVLGGAFVSPSSVDAVVVEGVSTWLEATISADDEGALYLIGRIGSVFYQLAGWVSNDGGLTFLDANNSAGIPMATNMGTASNDHPQGARTVHSGGRMFYFHGNDTSVSNQYYNALVTWGGWQGPYFERIAGNHSATYPPREVAERFSAGLATYNLTWWACALPESIGGSGWNPNTTGGPTAALGNGGLQVQAATGEEYYWDDTIATGGSGTAANDAWLRFAARVDDDNGGDDNVKFMVRTINHEFSVVLREDGFAIYDEDAAAFIGAAVAITAGVVVHYEVYIDDSADEVTVLHAESPTGAPFPTKWTKTERTLTGSSSNASERLQWGIIGATAGDMDATFLYLSFSSSFNATANSPPVYLEGDDGWGKAIPSVHGYPIPELGDSTTERQARLTMRGGPITAQQEYTHDTAPDYPIEACFPTEEPGPDTRWRSVDKSADTEIVWDLGAYDTLLAGSWSWAILAQNVNVRRLYVSGKASAAGSYTSLGTIDLATGFASVGYALTGNILRPGTPYTATDGARYIFPGELRGGHVILDPTGTPKLRKILYNTGGWWSGSSMKATIVLEGLDGTESATGTAHIVWPSGVFALHWDALTSIPTRYLKIQIDVSADDSPDSFYEIGNLAPFGIRVPGKQWHHGWEWDKTPNFRSDVDTRRTDRRRSLGPTQRKLTKSWDHGSMMVRLRGKTDGDYLGVASKAELVAQDEVWGELWELLELTDSAARPLLYLGQVPDHQATLTDPTLWMLCHLGAGGVRIQNSVGSEGINEFVRGGPITLTEVVG